MASLTDAQKKASIQRLNRQLTQFAKHLSTEENGVIKQSEKYNDIIAMAKAAGLELVQKGNYLQISSGRENLQKIKEDFVNKAETVRTWGKIKETFERTIDIDLKGKTRAEKEKILRERILQREQTNILFDKIFTDVYQWESSHRNFIITTFHEEKHMAYLKTYDELLDWQKRIESEMRWGGTPIDKFVSDNADSLADELGI